MNNKDMPVMPFTDIEYDGEGKMYTYKTHLGITKLEHFAGLAPPMPDWFELEFLQNPELNGGNDYVVVCGGDGATSQDGRKDMFIAWPVYYAKALLAQLDKVNNEVDN